MNHITIINHYQPPVSTSYLLRSAAYGSGTASPRKPGPENPVRAPSHR